MPPQSRILMNYQSSSGCDYYRSFMPVRHCKKRLEKEGVTLDISSEIDPYNLYDVYIFHRVISPRFLPTVCIIRETGRKIVWDIDDNLFAVPEWNPFSKGFGPVERNALAYMLRSADVVTTSTEALKSQLIESVQLNPERVLSLPNLIDVDEYANRRVRYVDGERGSPKKRVVWAGGESHKKDLDLIVPSILKLAEERDDVHFVFIGMMPKEFGSLDPGKFTSLFGCSIKHWAGFLCLVAPDISLIPLVDCPFNRGKSAIKYYESVMAGGIPIVSKVGPYSNILKNDVSGVHIYDGTSEEWEETIESALDGYFNFIRTNALNHVEKNYSWQSEKCEEWMKFFRGLVNSSG